MWIDPEVIPALPHRFDALICSHRHLPQAIELFTKAIDADTLNESDLARVYNNRGATYRRLGDAKAAVKDFSRAIRLRPKYFRAYVNRGAAYGDLGEFSDAEDDFKEAQKLRPQDMSSFMERAKTRAKEGRLDTAIDDLNEVIRVQPRNREAFLMRGQYYRSQGMYKRALEDFTSAIDLKGNEAEYFVERGLTLAYVEDYPAALSDMNMAANLGANDPENYYHRGLVHGALGNHVSAIEDYTRAIGLRPGYVAALYARSLAALTPMTLTDRDQVLERIDQARREGFAATDQEVLMGELAVSAAITDRDGRPIGAVQGSVSTASWTLDRVRAELAPKVVEAARLISAPRY